MLSIQKIQLIWIFSIPLKGENRAPMSIHGPLFGDCMGVQGYYGPLAVVGDNYLQSNLNEIPTPSPKTIDIINNVANETMIPRSHELIKTYPH